MRTPKSHKAVMEELAQNPRQTIYRLNKETGYSTSTLHAAIKRLTKNRIVKKHEGGYALTFKGLVQYLATRFYDPTFQHEEIKKTVATYADIEDYPPFTLRRNFQEWLGNGFYDYITSASYLVNHQFETSIHITYVKATKPVKRGEKIPLHIPTATPEEEQKEWKETLTLNLLNLTLTNPKTKNPKDQKIRNLITKTYKKQIQKNKEETLRLETALQKLTSTRTY